MKYVSQTEGVLLNVSYGDNLLRSGMSRGPRPGSTCVSMIGQLAAVCARFTSLLPHDDGLKGCLKLEPKLLGDVQTRLSIGCFAMNADGMRLDDSLQQELEQEQEATTVAPTDAVTIANTNQTNSVEENATWVNPFVTLFPNNRRSFSNFRLPFLLMLVLRSPTARTFFASAPEL